MNNRRNLLGLATGILPAAAIAVAGSGTLQANDGDTKDFLGGWNTVHTLPFPPGSFREFLTFNGGGGVHETNSFLNLATSQDFSAFGLPRAMKASDGIGTWERRGRNQIAVAFRKLLFDGAGVNFGDLKVTGTLRIDGSKLKADWFIVVVDTNDKTLLPFGAATSEGTRIE